MFKLKENGTTVGTEIIAGLSVFFTMVYVLSVHPALLATTGMPQAAIFTATAFSAILCTIIMGLWANLPFAVAPAMGINAFFAFVVVKVMGYSWEQALAAVFLCGVLFFIFSLSPLRVKVIAEVPHALKHAICVGVGLMLASIGLVYSGFITPENGLIKMADFSQPNALLVLIGLTLTIGMIALNIRYAIFFGIIASTLIGIPLGVTNISSLAGKSLIDLPPSLSPIFLHFDFSLIFTFDFIAVVFSFLLIMIIISLAGFLSVLSILGPSGDKYVPLLGKAFLADATSVIIGAVLGTSPNTIYGESGVGLAAGGRTGLTSLVIALCFVVALFCAPIFLIVPFAALTPALIIVGWLMASSVKYINFDEKTESLPAIIGILLIAFTWKIPDGLGVAWLAYILMKLLAKQTKDLNPTVLVIGLVFVLKFIFL